MMLVDPLVMMNGFRGENKYDGYGYPYEMPRLPVHLQQQQQQQYPYQFQQPQLEQQQNEFYDHQQKSKVMDARTVHQEVCMPYTPLYSISNINQVSLTPVSTPHTHHASLNSHRSVPIAKAPVQQLKRPVFDYRFVFRNRKVLDWIGNNQVMHFISDFVDGVQPAAWTSMSINTSTLAHNMVQPTHPASTPPTHSRQTPAQGLDKVRNQFLASSQSHNKYQAVFIKHMELEDWILGALVWNKPYSFLSFADPHDRSSANHDRVHKIIINKQSGIVYFLYTDAGIGNVVPKNEGSSDYRFFLNYVELYMDGSIQSSAICHSQPDPMNEGWACDVLHEAPVLTSYAACQYCRQSAFQLCKCSHTAPANTNVSMGAAAGQQEQPQPSQTYPWSREISAASMSASLSATRVNGHLSNIDGAKKQRVSISTWGEFISVFRALNSTTTHNHPAVSARNPLDTAQRFHTYTSWSAPSNQNDQLDLLDNIIGSLVMPIVKSNGLDSNIMPPAMLMTGPYVFAPNDRENTFVDQRDSSARNHAKQQESQGMAVGNIRYADIDISRKNSFESVGNARQNLVPNGRAAAGSSKLTTGKRFDRPSESDLSPEKRRKVQTTDDEDDDAELEDLTHNVELRSDFDESEENDSNIPGKAESTNSLSDSGSVPHVIPRPLPPPTVKILPKVVNGNTVYECPNCQRAFSVKSNCMRHIWMVHHDVRRFACTQCTRQFKMRSHLVAHVRAVHVRVKPYSCKGCNTSFASSSNLRRHMREFHASKK